MSLRSKLIGASLTLGLVATFGTFALAQQPPQSPQQPPPTPHGEAHRMKRDRHMGERPEGGMDFMRLAHDLDLTDAQKQQAHTILESHLASTKPQREELRQLREQREQGTLTADGEARAKTLREQLSESSKSIHTALLAILTPEQRTKLEQRMKERKTERREERRERRSDAPQGVH